MTSDPTEMPTVSTDDVLRVTDDRFAPESVAIVTGAASGIGRATALALAVNDLTVVATDVDADGLDQTADRASDLDVGDRVETVEGDLRSEDEIAAIVEAAGEAGDLRYVANVAGLQHISPIESFPTDTFDAMLDVMLRAPFLLTKHAMPHIRATDDGVGAIGNMASIHGHIATQDKVAYICSKFGLRGLTQSIAAEGDGTLRSFSISAGYVKTPLVTNQIPETAEERGLTEQEVVEDVMLGHTRADEMMPPIDIGNLFVYGFSDHASQLNGSDITVDGGQVATYI